MTEGTSDEEALLQLPFPTNCTNWVVGHILAGRNTALKILGAQPIWGDEIVSLYRSQSDPVTSAADARSFRDLRSDLDGQRRRTGLSSRQLGPGSIAVVSHHSLQSPDPGANEYVPGSASALGLVHQVRLGRIPNPASVRPFHLRGRTQSSFLHRDRRVARRKHPIGRRRLRPH